MDNKWVTSLVLVLIGFILGYLASFSAWGGAPRGWMMRPYGNAAGDYYGNTNPNEYHLDGRRGYGMMNWMMGYPFPGEYPTTTPDGTPINY